MCKFKWEQTEIISFQFQCSKWKVTNPSSTSGLWPYLPRNRYSVTNINLSSEIVCPKTVKSRCIWNLPHFYSFMCWFAISFRFDFPPTARVNYYTWTFPHTRIQTSSEAQMEWKVLFPSAAISIPYQNGKHVFDAGNDAGGGTKPKNFRHVILENNGFMRTLERYAQRLDKPPILVYEMNIVQGKYRFCALYWPRMSRILFRFL